LLQKSGLPESSLVVVGRDHRLAEPEALEAMQKAVARLGSPMPPSDKEPVRRLVPGLSFPPYSFVPGQAPHPFSDPAGHSFGVVATAPPKLHPAQWEGNQTYLFGFDLFNAGYYWESHEQWESLWHACGRTGSVADFLKALIKLAAAGVKHLEGNQVGVKSHACRAAAIWQSVAQSLESDKGAYLGFRIETLIKLAEDICQQGWPAGPVSLLPNIHQQ
jgi:uncharacterized protein